ncbi:MAG: 2Fe-2S iron-sulfur cluster-binding protein [Bacteroidota bacterium]|jgi:ferredoxin
MNDIVVEIETGGELQRVDVPDNIALSLMELLKGMEIKGIEGTCGGMALCATCHVRILSAEPPLPPAGDEELNMLDTLPVVYTNSRLACQIRLAPGQQQIRLCVP